MELTAMVYVRFERGRDCVIGPTYGPFDYLQVTYDTIRTKDNDLAVYSDGDWKLTDAESEETIFSDFIVYAAPVRRA